MKVSYWTRKEITWRLRYESSLFQDTVRNGVEEDVEVCRVDPFWRINFLFVWLGIIVLFTSDLLTMGLRHFYEREGRKGVQCEPIAD